MSDLSPNPRQHDEDCEVARALRLEVRAPDLTESILDRVAMHRTFLDRRARRLVWATRCTIGVGVLVLAGIIVFIHERYPQVSGEAPRPTPLSSVVASARDEARRLEAIRGRLEIPDAPVGAFSNVRLTISTPSPIVEKPQSALTLVTGAGAPRTVAVVSPAEENLEAPSALPSPPRALAQDTLPFPSTTEAVHRWALTADAPLAPRLLRLNEFDQAPLLLQGPISEEIRLPR